MTDLFDLVRQIGADAGGSGPVWEILLRLTVLLLVAMLVAAGLRRASAALRHLVWALSLVGTLLIPLCYWAFPAWQWAILPQREPSPLPSAVALDLAYSQQLSGPSADESFEVPAAPPETVGEESPAPLAPRSACSWPAVLGALWALGTSLGFVWLGIGIVGAWYVARHAPSAADAHWRQILQQLRAPGGFRGRIEVRECPQVSIPMTWGLRRPVILVPPGSAEWSEGIKRSVLLHELGHIRRGDCLVHLLGRLACVAYWFHPLVWLAARQLRKTSEQAADDVVLSSNIAPPDYARHLVGIAGQMRGIHLFGHVALPMASRSDLEGRVLAILDPRRNHGSLKRNTCYALVALAAVLLIPCALLRPGYAEDKTDQKPPETTTPSVPPTDATPHEDAPTSPPASTTAAKDDEPRASSGGKTKASERAIAGALNWLYRHQNTDGYWSLDFRHQCTGNPCSAPGPVRSESVATALALLPFLAAGQTHKSKGPYQPCVAKGIAWLITHQEADGDLAGKCERSVHAHAVATLALCSAFGMTEDPQLAEAAQKAVGRIERAQNQSTGGWRSSPQDPDDTTELGWQMMALKSAQCAGLKVAPNVLENAKKWLHAVARGEHHGLYADRPDQPGRPECTAVGMLCRQTLGVGPSEPAMPESAKCLLANVPDRERRNAPYWFYATVAMHNFGGPEWVTWNRKLRQALADSQDTEGCAAGSWEPGKATGDVSGEREGRLMTTCLSTLALEVYYRYLPIYRLDVKQGGTPVSPAARKAVARPAAKTSPGDGSLQWKVVDFNSRAYTDGFTLNDELGPPLIILPGYELYLRPPVLKALAVTDRQQERLRKVALDYKSAEAQRRREFVEKLGNGTLSSKELTSSLSAWKREERQRREKQMAEILTPRQMQAIRERKACGDALRALSGPKNDARLKSLQLSAEQSDQLRAMSEEHRRQAQRMAREFANKQWAILTSRQRAELREAVTRYLGICCYATLTIAVEGELDPIRICSLTPYDDFSEEDVQKELRLTTAQKNQVRDILGNGAIVTENLLRDLLRLSPAERKERQENIHFLDAGHRIAWGGLSAEERRKQQEKREKGEKEDRLARWAELESQPLMQMSIALRKRFEAILTPEQLATYQDMAVRSPVLSALNDSIILHHIGATREQEAELRRMNREQFDERMQFGCDWGQKMLDVLTPTQREKLRAPIDL